MCVIGVSHSVVLQLRPRFLASSRALPGFAASTKVSRVFSSSPGFYSFDEGFSRLLEFSRVLQLRRRFLEFSRVLSRLIECVLSNFSGYAQNFSIFVVVLSSFIAFYSCSTVPGEPKGPLRGPGGGLGSPRRDPRGPREPQRGPKGASREPRGGPKAP